MKTKTILASLVLAVSVAAVALTAWVNRPTDSFFEANLEALASTETHSGHCASISSNDCMVRCPVCGELIYADGWKGPAYGIVHN